MSKFFSVAVVIVTTSLVSSLVSAQQFSFQTGTANNPPASTGPQVLSPEDFKSQVGLQAKQNQQQNTQQALDYAKQQMSQLSLPSAAPTAPGKITPPPAASATDQTVTKKKKSKANNDSTATEPTSTAGDAVADTAASAPVPDVSATTPAAVAPAVPTTQQAQPQIYTGFQGGSSTNPPSPSATTAPSSSSNSGGWNVKY